MPDTTRILLGIFFAALLATPLVIKQWSPGGSSGASASTDASPAVDRTAALERYGFVLEDATAQAGVDFQHRAPDLDSSLAHIMPEVASMGASVSVADYNNDGHPDLYVTNSARGTANALYENQGDGTFKDVAPALGVANLNGAATGTSMGSVWGDYNNDGYEDLFVYRWGQPVLFRNDAGTGFTRVDAGFPERINANTAVWLDYNGDGRLDLFVGGFYPAKTDLWDLETTRMMPESFEYAQNGGRNYLFENQGNGRFENVADEVGLTSRRWTLAAVAADLGGSRHPELYLANDFGIDKLYFNEDGERFRPIGEEAGVGFTPKSGMNASLGDVLNRGQHVIYTSNISEEGVLLQGNNLWVPSGDSSQAAPTYQNMAGAFGVAKAGWSYGAQLGDLNNDGWQDLYVANGFISQQQDASYWYDFSKVASGHEDIIADAANWPDMENRSLSGHQRDRIWLNTGAGRFERVTQQVSPLTPRDGRAVAFVDLWDEGSLDIVVANQRGPLRLYRNTVADDRTWIAFDLTGTRSNRSAIGAEVELVWDDHRQVQTVTGGSGFSAQSQRRVHFGLGTDPELRKAVIRWPSGTTQTLTDLSLNTVHRVTEPAAS